MSTRIPKRGQVYYVQQAVPRDLQARLGCKQIWRSLETKDYEEAKGRHLKAKLAFRAEFERLRKELKHAEAQTAQQSPTSALPDQPRVSARAMEEWQLEQLEYELANSTPDYDDLSPEEQRIQDAVEAARERWDQERRDGFELYRELRAQEAAQGQPSQPSATIDEGTALTAAVNRWAEVRDPEQKTIDAMRQVVSWFEEDMGRIAVEAMTPDDVIAWTEKLLARTSPANARTKLARLNTLLRFSMTPRGGRIISANPAAGVSIEVKQDPEEDVQPFDLPALRAIFSSPVYSQDERPEAGAGEAAYWLPLLAILTGARLNELGQLRPKDILKQPYVDRDGKEREAWCIRIVADKAEGLKLKTKWSARRLPVHPELIRLGFIDYVEAARNAGEARIFPELKPDKYAHVTANWSKWFGRYLRGTCNVVDDRMVFHSFRHAFKDYAREAEIPEDVNDAITGHKGQSVARRYGSSLAFPLRPMVVAMGEYRVTGLQLPPPPPAHRIPDTDAVAAA